MVDVNDAYCVILYTNFYHNDGDAIYLHHEDEDNYKDYNFNDAFSNYDVLFDYIFKHQDNIIFNMLNLNDFQIEVIVDFYYRNFININTYLIVSICVVQIESINLHFIVDYKNQD